MATLPTLSFWTGPLFAVLGTGMILIFEMTGAFNQALPMLWACFAAVAIPTLMGNMPIYDAMKARTIGVAKKM